MKKLLLVLLVASSFAFADNDCAKVAQKVVDKLSSVNRTSVTLNYSSDKAELAETCKNAILAKNAKLTVNMNQVQGSNTFKFSK